MNKPLTINELIAAYKSDPDSAYVKPADKGGLRWKTKENVDSLLKRIGDDMGFVQVGSIDARFMLRMHEQWTERGVSIAHSLIAQLRTLATFGATLLKSKDCRELKITLHDMKFKNAKPRTIYLTAEQADAIRHHARTAQIASMALAQAFLFDPAFRQKDVIGEWIPEDEPGEAHARWHGQKWFRGLLWEEIDADLILHHVTSKRGKLAEPDLKLCPMIIDELLRAYPGLVKSDAVFDDDGEMIVEMVVDRSVLPASGPVIVNEESGRPWTAPKFRATWRALARAGGIPDHVQSRDSRAGRISEVTANGGSLEDAKELAGHSDIATTQIYSRAKQSKVRKAQQSIGARLKPGTIKA